MIKIILKEWNNFTNNSNILCVKDTNYCIYNTDNKIVYYLYDHYNILSIDGSKSLKTLGNLKNIYNEFIYNIPEKV